MMTPAVAEHESHIVERLVTSPESARGILSITFSADDEQRMQELMDKNNKGTITDEERAEMESYRRVGNFLGIMQARARLFLQKAGDDH